MKVTHNRGRFHPDHDGLCSHPQLYVCFCDRIKRNIYIEICILRWARIRKDIHPS